MSDDKRHLWYLRKIPVLAAFPPSALVELAGAADLRERPRKTCLYLAGDAADRVYFLHGGRVSALHVPDGSRAVCLGLFGPTDVFGESCLWTAAPREHMAVTATAVLVTEVPRALLRLLLDDHPVAASLFAEQAITRRDLVIRRLSIAMSASVRARLAGQLLELGEHGRDTSDGRELVFPLTHHELAALIGTTRETVSVELQRLRREGLILIHRRQIVLRDLSRLRVHARTVSLGAGRRRAPPPSPDLARASASLATCHLQAP
ncbi:MAG TPA: Crp/Fnr family transcriptional regulator [Nannocystaceae bacterium]|nr:Crp/Fnr family transcriptional regulator [Nannocystaceae bacterium]